MTPARECRHGNADHVGPFRLEHPSLFHPIEHLVCLDCGVWLSLGPSADDDERVRVEIRAAELAARRGFGSFSNCGAGCERCGFVTHKSNNDSPYDRCNARQFDAGWLAREIATHPGGEGEL